MLYLIFSFWISMSLNFPFVCLWLIWHSLFSCIPFSLVSLSFNLIKSFSVSAILSCFFSNRFCFYSTSFCYFTTTFTSRLAAVFFSFFLIFNVFFWIPKICAVDSTLQLQFLLVLKKLYPFVLHLKLFLLMPLMEQLSKEILLQ